jgi:hypothetical protein
MKTFTERTATRGAPPWGYRRSEANPRKLEPDTDALALLEEAFDYIDRNASYRDTARWLSVQSGFPLSHVSLFRKYLKRMSEKTRLSHKSSKIAELAGD